MPPPRAFASLGCFVAPAFLPASAVSTLAAAGLASPGESAIVDADEVRRDIRAAEEVDGPDGWRVECDARLEALRPALAAHFGVPLGRAEPAGLLRYPPGGFYRPHRDRASGGVGGARAVSVVVFVNDRGGAHRYDGGALRIFGLLGAGPLAEVGLDVEPEAGTLLAFRSEWLHEVTPVTSGVRLTVVTWFPAVTDAVS